MNVVKNGQGGQGVTLTPDQLAEINRFSRKELTQEQVYPFAVRLCDNEVDRDGECFPRETLEELAVLFVGKSGIFDHQWSAHGQTARIYRTEVVEEPGVTTGTGEGYCWLKGYAYMVRTPENQALRDEIDGGIKKEVSVGCAVERSVCSICGQDWDGGTCGHLKGEVYEGKPCFVRLEHATDAFEFSFVAVPAQPAAGVVKGRKGMTLKDLVQGEPGCAKQLEELERQARMGRHWMAQMQDEVVKLGQLAQKELDEPLLRAMVKGLKAEQLEQLRSQFAAQAARTYPIQAQFSYAPEKREEKAEGDRAFLI